MKKKKIERKQRLIDRLTNQRRRIKAAHLDTGQIDERIKEATK